jgi:hypothetical protein
MAEIEAVEEAAENENVKVVQWENELRKGRGWFKVWLQLKGNKGTQGRDNLLKKILNHPHHPDLRMMNRPERKGNCDNQICPGSGDMGNSTPDSSQLRQVFKPHQKVHRDLKSAKSYIKLAPDAPRGVPMSEWEHIFKSLSTLTKCSPRSIAL